MSDGWRCPVCARGVAPTEKYCNHGPYWTGWDWGRGAGGGGGSTPSADCGCPSYSMVCGNSACPRRTFTTCETK